MPKILLFFSLFWIFLFSLSSSAYAVTCFDPTSNPQTPLGLNYEPRLFLENSGFANAEYTLTFFPDSDMKKFFDSNTKTKVSLVYDNWGSGYVEVNTTENSFEIKIPKTDQNNKLFEQGEKNVKLEYGSSSSISGDGVSCSSGKCARTKGKEFCKDISLAVGIPPGKDGTQTCLISYDTPDPSDPSKIIRGTPTTTNPNGKIDIRFLSRPNLTHEAYLDNILRSSTNTNNSGWGQFTGVVVNGKNGETKKIYISSKNPKIECSTTVSILDNITQPDPLSNTFPTNFPLALLKGPSPLHGPAGQPCDYNLNIGRFGTGKGQGIKTAIGCIPTNPRDLVVATLVLGQGIGGGIAFLIMLFGAFQLITSAGNPDTVKAGHDKIINAVIGLLFVIFSVLLLQIIGQHILKIPGFQP